MAAAAAAAAVVTLPEGLRVALQVELQVEQVVVALVNLQEGLRVRQPAVVVVMSRQDKPRAPQLGLKGYKVPQRPVVVR